MGLQSNQPLCWLLLHADHAGVSLHHALNELSSKAAEVKQAVPSSESCAASSGTAVSTAPVQRVHADAGTDSVVDDDQTYTLSFHEVGGVGLDFAPDGRWMCSGDLSGTVHVWSVPEGKMHRQLPDAASQYRPVASCNVAISVRALLWLPLPSSSSLIPAAASPSSLPKDDSAVRQHVVLIGCMDGALWLWTLGGLESADRVHAGIPLCAHTLLDQITCLKSTVQSADGTHTVAVVATTSDGTISIFDVKSAALSGDSELVLRKQWLAHPPVQQGLHDPEYRQKFGSLHLKGESAVFGFSCVHAHASADCGLLID